MPVIGALVALVITIRHATGPPATESAKFKRPIPAGFSSTLGSYLDAVHRPTGAYSTQQLQTPGLRFQLPVRVRGLAGSKVAVFAGLYDGKCSESERAVPVRGGKWTPEAQDSQTVTDFWVETDVTPPGEYCYRLALGRHEDLLLDAARQKFPSATPATSLPHAQFIANVTPPEPEVYRVVFLPQTTPTATTGQTTTNPLRELVPVPTQPVGPEDVPEVLRAPVFPKDYLEQGVADMGEPGTQTTSTGTTSTGTTSTGTTSTGTTSTGTTSTGTISTDTGTTSVGTTGH